MFAGAFVTAHHTLNILVLITLRATAERTIGLRARCSTLLNYVTGDGATLSAARQCCQFVDATLIGAAATAAARLDAGAAASR